MYAYVKTVLLTALALEFIASADAARYPQKSLMNRACRATWICGETKCLGVDDERWTNCNGNKNCKSDLENWVLLGANKQWGKKSVQNKAIYNMVKTKNCKRMFERYSWVKKQVQRTIKDISQYGYKVKTGNGLDLCDIVSRVCIASPKGIKKGMPEQTMIVSLNPDAKKYPTGAESTRTYYRAFSINGKTDGYVSAKQH